MDDFTDPPTVLFPGKTVFVRKYAEQKRPILCELVHEDQDQAIVRHIETGHYFRTQTHLIDYPDEPQMSPIYEVSFHPIDSNQTLMVTYAVNNLRWHARYILQTFASGDTRFQILADIINSGPLRYQFNSTELMSGDFNLVFGNGKSSSLMATTPSTENTVDYSGIHVFSRIDDLVTIEPNSILTLPILSPHIQIRMFFIYNLILTMPVPISNSALSITSGKHKFHRLYQLSNSSSYLPTGHLLLYDSPSHVLTGEWHLPTLTESEKYEFELGEDPDIMLIYNRTMTVNRTTNSSLVTTHVLIQNYKQRRVNIRFKSACQLLMTCLFYDDKARSLGSRLRYNLTLEAKSEVAFAFTAVRLSWTQCHRPRTCFLETSCKQSFRKIYPSSLEQWSALVHRQEIHLKKTDRPGTRQMRSSFD